MCIDIKNFYLCAPMDRYEYKIMKLTYFPKHVQQKYNLYSHAKMDIFILNYGGTFTAFPKQKN